MAGLLSAAQLGALSSLVESGMATSVEILRRGETDDAYADDDTLTWTSKGSVKAWIRHLPSGVLQVVGGVVGNVSNLRVLVPLGSDILNGDRLVFVDPVMGHTETFVVQDTNEESTYKTHMWVEVRHLD